jgi:hypothetical protein
MLSHELNRDRTRRRLAGDVVSNGQLMEADEVGTLAALKTRRCNELNALARQAPGPYL